MSHVDNSKNTTHVSLCAGYGGIDLGLKRAIPNLCTIAFSEIEAFACANLVSKMEAGFLDSAPIWTDLKTFPWGYFRDRVDILSGGYPCQPFSAAGKRLGKEDPRHLWPWIADGIILMRPRICFFENVEGHISMGLRDVIEDLGRMGYRTTWGIFSASEVGAPHQRKRVFILAHNQRERVEELTRKIAVSMQYPPLGTAVLLADSYVRRSPSGIPEQEQRHEGQSEITHHDSRGVWPSRPGEPQYSWEPPRVIDRIGTSSIERSMADGDCLDRGTSPERREHDGEAGSASEGVVDAKGKRANSGQQLCGENGGQDGCLLGQSQSTGGEAGCVAHNVSGVIQRRPGIGYGGRKWQQEQTGEHGVSGYARPEEIESPMGGDSDGSSYRMDDAELQVSCDNRTDELRLLGNGVVPATAELAFRTLINEIL